MNSQNESHFELGELFGIIWRRKWYIVIPTILAAGAAFGLTFFLTPVYETSSIIWVGSTIQLSGNVGRMTDEITAIGQSRNRTEELRSLRNEIKSSPYISKLIGRLELLKNKQLDSRAAKLQEKWPHMTIEQIKLNILLEDLRERIHIDFSGASQIQITAESPDPYEAQEIAKDISGIFISEKKTQQLGTAVASRDFSNEQLSKYEDDLNAKINERTQLEKDLLKVQLDEMITSDENRRDINSEIQATKIEITDKEEEAKTVLRKLTDIPSNKVELNESEELRRLKREVKSLLASIANLMLRYRWSDPEILNFKSRLYTYMDRIEDENRRLVGIQYSEYDENTRENLLNLFNVRSQLSMLYNRQNNLELAQNDLNNKMGLTPEYQAELDRLNREVTAARDLRDEFKQQLESAQISQAVLNESEYKVIQPAQLPLSPVFPDVKKIVIMGIMLGLVLGGGLILIRELLDNTFRKVEDVEQHLGLPVIGVIPDIISVKKARAKA